jgi:hypothetical protein
MTLGVAGCAISSPDVAAEPTAAPSASPTATPSATADPVADAPTCNSVLDPASTDAYAAHGWVASVDYGQRALDEGWPTAAFVTWGGILCQWGMPGTDASEYYGFSEITPEHEATITARLVSEGFTREDHGDGSLYVGPTTEGINERYFFAGGHWFVGFSPGRIDEIRGNAGLG